MALTTLPAGARLAFDYTEELDRGLIVSDMEGGPGKQRPRFSRPMKKRQAKLVILSFEAKKAFEQWWDSDLAGGCLWFNFNEPFEQKIIEARFAMPKLSLRPTTKHLWEATVIIESVGL